MAPVVVTALERLGLKLRRLAGREDFFAGELVGPFQGRDRAEVPNALEVGRSPRGARRVGGGR